MAAKKQVSPAVAAIVIILVVIIVVAIGYMTLGKGKAKQGDVANPQMLQGGTMEQMQKQMKSKGMAPGGGGGAGGTKSEEPATE